MRSSIAALSMLALAACGGSSSRTDEPIVPPPATGTPIPPAPADPAPTASASAIAPRLADPAPDPAVDAAKGFLTAVGKRDEAAALRFLPSPEMCERIVPKQDRTDPLPARMAECKRDAAANARDGYREYAKRIPAGFVPGEAKATRDKLVPGVTSVLVEPKVGSGGALVLVMIVEGTPLVVIARRK